MAITVKSETYDDFHFKEVNNIYTLQNTATITLKCIHNKIKIKYKFTFRKGFMCDGLSVPKVFQWFLKKWDNSNMLYNLARCCT